MLKTKFTRSSLRLGLAIVLCAGFALSALAIYLPPGQVGSWQPSSIQDCAASLTCMEWTLTNGTTVGEPACVDRSTLDFEDPRPAGFRHDH
ncbi:MAG: hypothetical protein K0U98_19850 [Deltaproteobacteria bacterium]|nr:hypothetical protein [Deltaproteobacteria bacterium]